MNYTIPVGLSVLANTVGVSGQLQLQARANESLVLPPSTSQQLVPLPAGMSVTNFAAITAVSVSDLFVQFSTAFGSTVLSVPQGTTLLVYGVSTIYVSSALGGAVGAVIG